ncbi:uncharacterized protein [Physcomitrium patens]|uniref:Uncharacterized protein n=1 Tax=Physcomitrium patens TaxID=3218 RepID=A0A7I4DVT3_PHYPA|nr:uncharacterized protein LOC112282190 isoform X2 [Physcomitrium patens]|eukprot:XP_024375313.1 uncharacterized protein LOC112282190 isoform X2 [Physcomitrella patens]
MTPSAGQVQSSGIVLQHYAEPDKVTGICLPSWRITSSSIVYSSNLASGTATTVKGEVYVRGERAYRFQADVATIDAVSYPNSVLQVLGNLKVAEKTTGATLHCKVLTWEAVSQILRLGGPATNSKRLNTLSGGSGLGLRTVGASNRGVKGVLPALDEQMMSLSLGDSQHWKSPAIGVKRKRIFPAIVASPKEASQKSNSSVDVIVNAEEGLIFDFARGRIHSPGFLSLSCPALQAEVHAGAGEVILHKDTSVFLQGGVSAKVKSFNLQAQRLYFSVSDADAHFKTDGLKFTRVNSKSQTEIAAQTNMAEQEIQVSAFANDTKFPPNAVVRFDSRLSQMYIRSPGLRVHPQKHFTACHSCCYAECSIFGSSRIVLRRNKPLSNMRGIVQVLGKQLLSSLHVSLRTGQNRNFVGIDFTVSEWFTSSPKILMRGSIDQETLLAAFNTSGNDILIAEGDVRIWWQ